MSEQDLKDAASHDYRMESGLIGFVGRTVVEILRNTVDEGNELAFILDDGTVIEATCFGDCCSYTWIEHITGIRALLGAQVEKVDFSPEFAETTEETDPSIGDVIAYYGVTLITNRLQRVDIDYRNDSNGYYGGNLE